MDESKRIGLPQTGQSTNQSLESGEKVTSRISSTSVRGGTAAPVARAGKEKTVDELAGGRLDVPLHEDPALRPTAGDDLDLHRKDRSEPMIRQKRRDDPRRGLHAAASETRLALRKCIVRGRE